MGDCRIPPSPLQGSPPQAHQIVTHSSGMTSVEPALGTRGAGGAADLGWVCSGRAPRPEMTPAPEGGAGGPAPPWSQGFAGGSFSQVSSVPPQSSF